MLFSAGFMAFLFLKVDWKHFSSIWDRLDMKYLLISFGVVISANLVRTFRFFRLDHTGKKLSYWWIVNQFYNFMTATLPGGAGEAATAYFLKRFSFFDMLGAFRILILTRLMDLAALSALLLVASSGVSGVTPYRNAAIWISGALCIISTITLIPASERLILRLMQKIPGQSALRNRVCGKLDELLRISEEQHSNNSFGIMLFQSALIMLAVALSVHLLLRSLGVDFTLVQSFYCFGIYAVFQIVPIQGIAGIGTQAAWWSLALKIAGYDASDVIALGIILHGIFYLFIVFLGVPSVPIWLRERKNLIKMNVPSR